MPKRGGSIMKRCLSLLLCLVMALSLIPAAAAEDIEIVEEEELEALPGDEIEIVDTDEAEETAEAVSSGTISSTNIEKAISYAYNEQSTRPDYWKGYCAAFVWASYYHGAGIGNPSYPTAREMGDALITHIDANPPRGAFVFWYKTSDPYNHAGHVGLSLGDGTVIHAFSSIKVTKISSINSSGYTYRGWGAPIAGYTLASETPVTELTLTGAVYPSGHYDSLPNFGLRGVFSSPNTITKISAGITDSNGSSIMSYDKTWDKKTYDIRYDGLNDAFVFKNLKNGFYQYFVYATDSSGKKVGVSSWFSLGTVVYTVSFNANGGLGAPSAQTKTHGMALTLSSTKPTRSGYSFTGWHSISQEENILTMPV